MGGWTLRSRRDAADGGRLGDLSIALIAMDAGALASTALFAAAGRGYDSLLSGVPDDTRMPVAMLPAFLWLDETVVDLSSNDQDLMLWLVSCAVWLVGPFLATAISRDLRAALITGCAFAMLAIAAAWCSLPPPGLPQPEFVPTYNVHMRWVGMIWVTALAFFGVALGWLFTAARLAARAHASAIPR
jgi:hypothetical protein